ncbi:MAG: lipoyl synthase [bacterium]
MSAREKNDFHSKSSSQVRMEIPDARSAGIIRRAVYSRNLRTICEEACCPNRADCYGRNEVTFLILGRVCSRNCRFCNVEKAQTEPLNPTEPQRILDACIELGLRYVVITSVTRDDLPDGGSSHFANCVLILKSAIKDCGVEVLTPDFNGNLKSLDNVCQSGIDVFAHNIETVESLYGFVRDRANYKRSLSLLQYCRDRYPGIVTKSGLMLGLGETFEEVGSTLRHLSEVGCQIVTIGQYLQPSRRHLKVERFIEAKVFNDLAILAESLGMTAVSGAHVRSSFRAESAFLEAKSRRQRCA